MGVDVSLSDSLLSLRRLREHRAVVLILSDPFYLAGPAAPKEHAV